ncbi:ATP-dependent RNA helicase RhlE [BD1-7 clade bacterium]|nr:ATP-dependent RNA helicase RhlE [BD1-7 clade bacterium]
MTFPTLGLSEPIVKAIREQGYTAPTDIQAQVIPAILAGNDVLASAPTGTGKTAGFVLPILENLGHVGARRAKRIRALVLVPTRELALQVNGNITEYARHLDIRSEAIVGGVDAEPQKQALIDGVDILVATPGRLLDLAHQRAVHFDELRVLVLDEADRMLDMGFADDIEKIINRLPEQRQNLLFSATLSDDIHGLAHSTLNNAIEITATPNHETKQHIHQWAIPVDKDIKSALLSHLIHQNAWNQALIFIRTKHGAAKLVSQLEKRGITAEAFHSGRSQPARTQLLADFKSGKIQFMIATGVASRGIDIDNLERVINYDLPDDADDYIHRIGRTGRAGEQGDAISLVSKDDFKRLCAIERRLDQIIVRKEVDGFVVKKPLPASDLNYVAKSAPTTTNPPSRKKKTEQKRRPADNKPTAPAPRKTPDPWAKSRKG